MEDAAAGEGATVIKPKWQESSPFTPQQQQQKVK